MGGTPMPRLPGEPFPDEVELEVRADAGQGGGSVASVASAVFTLLPNFCTDEAFLSHPLWFCCARRRAED